MDVQTQQEKVSVNGEQMSVYVAAPEREGTFPPVLLFMEIFGVNDHIQDVTRRLAQEGYVVAAMDYYHRIAPDINLGYTQDDVEKGKDLKSKTTQQGMLDDTQATIDFLKNHPKVEQGAKFGSIGFCFGGYVAYRVAVLPEIGITASFYGAGVTRELPGMDIPPVDLSDQIKGEVLCFFGGKDGSITPEDIEMVEHSLNQAHVQHTVVTYPEADHGFFCDRRGSYEPEAALDAWSRVTTEFADKLKTASVA